MSRNDTPKEFLNHVEVDHKIYVLDSLKILDSLYSKMHRHVESFEIDEYFDSTKLFIDTIIYNRSLNKIAVFVIAENPISRNPYSDSKLPYYYNANIYLGRRLNDTLPNFELMCLCKFYVIHFYDKYTVSKALREIHFQELSTVLDENDQPIFKYNINDVRFWDSPTGWKGTFE